MGAAKNNPTTVTVFGRGRFSSDLIQAWEADRCAAFTVAIERLRGWPVHATFIGDEVVRLQALKCITDYGASDTTLQAWPERGLFPG